MLRSKNFTFEKTPDGAYYVIRHIKCGTRYANVTLEFVQSSEPDTFGALHAVIMPFPGFYTPTGEIIDLVLEEGLRLSPRVWWTYAINCMGASSKHAVKKGSGNVYYVDRPAEPTDIHPQDGGVRHGDNAAGGSCDVPGVQGLVDNEQPREGQSDSPAGPRDIPF